MQHVETQQRVGVDRISAQQQEVDLFAHDRNCRCDVRSHRNRPIGQLIPGKQVSGVAEQQT